MAMISILFQDMLHIGAGNFFIIDNEQTLLGGVAEGLGGEKFKNTLLDLEKP